MRNWNDLITHSSHNVIRSFRSTKSEVINWIHNFISVIPRCCIRQHDPSFHPYFLTFYFRNLFPKNVLRIWFHTIPWPPLRVWDFQDPGSRQYEMPKNLCWNFTLFLSEYIPTEKRNWSLWTDKKVEKFQERKCLLCQKTGNWAQRTGGECSYTFPDFQIVPDVLILKISIPGVS